MKLVTLIMAVALAVVLMGCAQETETNPRITTVKIAPTKPMDVPDGHLPGDWTAPQNK